MSAGSGTDLKHITHWIGGKPWTGSPSAPRGRLRPGHRPGHRARRPGQPRPRWTPRWRRPRRPPPTGGQVSLSRRAAILFTFRELVQGAHRRTGRADHRRARQGGLRRGRRGGARPGSRRVRLRHPAPAQGRVLGERVHRRRLVLAPAAARRGRGHHPVQLPGHGADVDVPHGHRLRQHVRAQAVGEGPVRLAAAGVAVGRGRPARRRVQRACRGTRTRSTRSSTTRMSPRSASSAPPRWPGTSTSTGTQAGKRVQALGGAKNHMVVLPDADLDLAADAAVSAGFGSAGERCMAISAAGRGGAGRRRADRADPRPDQPAAGRPGHRRAVRDGAAGHRGAPGPGGLLPGLRGPPRAPRWRSTAGPTR